jgi:hypothetical protein
MEENIKHLAKVIDIGGVSRGIIIPKRILDVHNIQVHDYLELTITKINKEKETQ